MREIRLSGLEGGVAGNGHPYPYVRLRALMNGRVKVPDLANTLGPVTESNCIGAIPPGGEQLEVNDQSVTTGLLK